MIRFLFKGLMRDKSRSLLPVIVVALGVIMTVVLQSLLSGVIGDSIETTADFTTGHVKVMTRAYNANMSQLPNDLALIGADTLKKSLQKQFPDMTWAERIQFGGLLDAPDSSGHTRAQGNVAGMGIQLLKSTEEIDRINLRPSLVSGKFPSKPGEMLLSDELFHKMNLKLGDKVTLISSGMFGDMAMYNFRISGTLHFGVSALDRGMMIADIEDVRSALNMENAAGEILGFITGERYDNKKAKETAETFNARFAASKDKFAPVMLPLSDMNDMSFYVAYSENMQSIIVMIFVIAMSLVLWNAGLIGGLRRYGEFGLRLAIGESKHEVYRTIVGESVLIGVLGSIIGVAIGLLISWYLSVYGINYGDMMKGATFMMPSVMRSHISLTTFYIGFVPGIFSTVIGASLAGIGVYKRQTANLFKELEG